MNNNSLNALLSTDIPDPTDFPVQSIAPGLRDLDTSLRCNICSELFEAPVTLPCGHCFCSYCIRNAMSDKPECPNCRKGATEGNLRTNPVVEEVVVAWKMARAFVLRLSKREEEELLEQHTPKTPKTPRKGSQSRKKRKRSHDSDSDPSSSAEIEIVPGPSCKGGTGNVDVRASPRKQRKVNREPEPTDHAQAAAIPTSDSGEEEMQNQPKGLFVNCPMCNKRVKYARINTHIDNQCSSGEEVSHEYRSKKSEWSKLMAPGNQSSGLGKGKEKHESDDDPIPKATYPSLKDRQLKDMLTEHKLPVTGDRNTWIARHQRWVMIFNANLDRSRNQRRSKQDLRKDLKKWEDERKGKKNVVNDVMAHQQTHKSEFANLIEAARPKKVAPHPEQGETVDNTLSPKDDVRHSPAQHHSYRPTTSDEDVIVLDSEEEGLLM